MNDKLEILYEEKPAKYKKYKGSRSHSNKRSTHKHEYENVILMNNMFSHCGWIKRCNICGRFQSLSYAGLRKPNYDNKYTSSAYLSYQELREKYPNTRIFRRPRDAQGHLIFDDNAIEEIPFEYAPTQD